MQTWTVCSRPPLNSPVPGPGIRSSAQESSPTQCAARAIILGTHQEPHRQTCLPGQASGRRSRLALAASGWPKVVRHTAAKVCLWLLRIGQRLIDRRGRRPDPIIDFIGLDCFVHLEQRPVPGPSCVVSFRENHGVVSLTVTRWPPNAVTHAVENPTTFTTRRDVILADCPVDS